MHISERFELLSGLGVDIGGHAGPLPFQGRFELGQEPTAPDQRATGEIVGLTSVRVVTVELGVPTEIRRERLDELPTIASAAAPVLPQ